jgi:hypothetical protein
MAEPIDQPITFEARRTAARLHGALKVLVSMHCRMTLPQAMTFLDANSTQVLSMDIACCCCSSFPQISNST